MNISKSFIVFALALLVSLSFASALSFSSPATLTRGSNSTTFSLSTDDLGDTNITSLVLNPLTIVRGGATLMFAAPTPTTSQTASFIISSSNPRDDIRVRVQSAPADLPFGTYETTLTATGTNSSGAIVNASIPVTYVESFCRAGAQGTNLTIRNIDITSSGDEDLEWKLVDKVDVEVKVENNGDNDIDDVQIEIGLFDSEGRNVVNDLDFDNTDEEQADIGNLNDGDDETVTFSFRVPADFDTGNYKLTVKVYSDDETEARMCDDESSDLNNIFYQTISIDSESDEEKFVIVDDIQLPDQATCGETVTGTFKVFNIGDEDQDQILITMKNLELGLNQEFEIREDVNQGDDETLDFTFDVPSNVQGGTYVISFRTSYSYDDGRYEQDSEDEFISSLRVIGCGTPQTPGSNDRVTINAELDSDAQAGKELVVSATFTNRGTTEATYSINADGYDSWAELSSISRRSLTLAAGESKTVELVFNVNTDVSGLESFVLTATSDNQVETQDVEVDFGTAPSTGGFSFTKGSGFIWIIGIINVVLIVLIILVAVRLSRR